MKKLYITLMICISAINVITAQQEISISNFSAEMGSNSELLVSVDYSFSGETNTKDLIIQAYPVMMDGKANYKDVLFERHSLESGDHRVNFKISKKSGGKSFNSGSIRVCMINRRSILLCEEFPYTMLWKETKSASTPKILLFTSSENLAVKGEIVTLSWQTENASKVRLGIMGTTEFEDVPPIGSKEVTTLETVSYVLMASPESSKEATKVVSKKLKIEVASSKPVIASFYASHPTIRRGLNSTLLWKVYNADKVTLNGESVEAIGDKIVSPIRTKSYVLKAQKNNKIVEENISVYVTPFGAPTLSSPITSLELCKSIDTSGGDTRCISSDGPFYSGDTIYLIARFKNLPKGKHNVKRITYKGFFNNDKWTKAHEEESSFENPGTGEGILTFPIANLGEGAKKLKIIFNNNQKTASEIVYCIDCSRIWE